MELEVGSVLEGKVTAITKFGAFVALPTGKSGLVHISEIADSYVNDVHDHLTENQEVKVKVLSIDENGRINLSIKKAQPAAQKPAAKPAYNNNNRRPAQNSSNTAAAPAAPKPEQSFEDKLKQFMQESDSKISGIKQYSERKSSTRKGRGNNKG